MTEPLSPVEIEVLAVRDAGEGAAVSGRRLCETHNTTGNAWGCPECVRELRDENAKLRARVEKLERCETACRAIAAPPLHTASTYVQIAKAALAACEEDSK